MKLDSPISYMHLGNNLRYLREADSERPIGGENFVLAALEETIATLKEMKCGVSMAWIENNAWKFLTEMKKMIEDSDENKEAKFSSKRAGEFVSKMIELESVVFAELSTRKIAMPTPRRYDLEKLTAKPGELFPKNVFDRLPLLVKFDAWSGCKSIAFDLPTAGAFHLLRATEGCVQLLHEAYFPRGDRDKKNWGALINELKTKPRKPKPDEQLLEHLDYLRNRFRNPTNHPEKIYEIDEAQDVLNLCIDTISRVLKDPKVKTKQAVA